MALPPGGTRAMKNSLLRAASIANGPCAKGEQRIVELAIAYDTSFCDLFGNDAEKKTSFVSGAVRDAKTSSKLIPAFDFGLSMMTKHVR